MRRHLAILVWPALPPPVARPMSIGAGVTRADDHDRPDQPVDSDGDEPIAEPGPVGSIPELRPPIDGASMARCG